MNVSDLSEAQIRRAVWKHRRRVVEKLTNRNRGPASVRVRHAEYPDGQYNPDGRTIYHDIWVPEEDVVASLVTMYEDKIVKLVALLNQVEKDKDKILRQL